MGGVADAVSSALGTDGGGGGLLGGVSDVVQSIGNAVNDVANTVAPVFNSIGQTIKQVGDSAVHNPIGTIASIAAIATGQVELLPLISAIDTVAHGGNLLQAAEAAGLSYASSFVASNISSAILAPAADSVASIATADAANLSTQGLSAAQISQTLQQSYELTANIADSMANAAASGVTAPVLASAYAGAFGSGLTGVIDAAGERILAQSAGNAVGNFARTLIATNGNVSAAALSGFTSAVGTAVGQGTTAGLNLSEATSPAVASVVGAVAGATAKTLAVGQDPTKAIGSVFVNNLIATNLGSIGDAIGLPQIAQGLKTSLTSMATDLSKTLNSQVRDLVQTQTNSQDYYSKVVTPTYTAAQTAYDALNTANKAYTDAYTKYAPDYTNYQDLVTKYNAAVAANDSTTANGLAAQVNALATTLGTESTTLTSLQTAATNAGNTYNTTYDNYQKYATEYQNQVTSINSMDAALTSGAQADQTKVQDYVNAVTTAMTQVNKLSTESQQAFYNTFGQNGDPAAAANTATIVNSLSDVAQSSFNQAFIESGSTTSALNTAQTVNGLSKPNQLYYQTATDSGLSTANAIQYAPKIAAMSTTAQSAFYNSLNSSGEIADPSSAFKAAQQVNALSSNQQAAYYNATKNGLNVTQALDVAVNTAGLGLNGQNAYIGVIKGGGTDQTASNLALMSQAFNGAGGDPTGINTPAGLTNVNAIAYYNTAMSRPGANQTEALNQAISYQQTGGLFTNSPEFSTVAVNKADPNNAAMAAALALGSPSVTNQVIAGNKDVISALNSNDFATAQKLAMTYTGTFNDAFGQARGAGLQTFYWNGQAYNTDVKVPGVPTTVTIDPRDREALRNAPHDIPAVQNNVLSKPLSSTDVLTNVVAALTMSGNAQGSPAAVMIAAEAVTSLLPAVAAPGAGGAAKSFNDIYSATIPGSTTTTTGGSVTNNGGSSWVNTNAIVYADPASGNNYVVDSNGNYEVVSAAGENLGTVTSLPAGSTLLSKDNPQAAQDIINGLFSTGAKSVTGGANVSNSTSFTTTGGVTGGTTGGTITTGGVTGGTIGNITNGLSDLGVLFTTALNKNGGDTTKAINDLATQFNTSVTNMTDQINSNLSTAFTTALNKNGGDTVKAINDLATQYGVSSANMTTQLTTQLGTGFDKVQSGLVSMGTNLSTAFTNALNKNGGDTTKAINDLATQFGVSSSDMTTQLTNQLGTGFTDLSKQIATGTTSTTGAINNLSTAFTAALNKNGGDTTKAINDLATQFGVSTADMTTKLTTQLGSGFTDLTNQVQSGLSTVGQQIQAGTKATTGALSDLSTAFTAALNKNGGDTTKAINDLATQFGTSSADMTNKLTTALGAGFTTLGGQVQSGLQNQTDAINTVGTNIGNQISTGNKAMADAIATGDKNIISQMQTGNQDVIAAMNAGNTNLAKAIADSAASNSAGLANVGNSIDAQTAAQTAAAKAAAAAQALNLKNQQTATQRTAGLNYMTQGANAAGTNGGIQNLTAGLTKADQNYTLAGMPTIQESMNPLEQIPKFATGGSTTQSVSDLLNPNPSGDSVSSGLSSTLKPSLTKAQINYILTGLPGNLIEHKAAGGEIEGHNPEFFSEGGLGSMDNRYVKGDGDGTSDSVPAMLANGEFVIPADVVSKLGNGSNEAGAGVLDQFLKSIRVHAQSNGDKLPPDSKGPLAYLLDAKRKVKA